MNTKMKVGVALVAALIVGGQLSNSATGASMESKQIAVLQKQVKALQGVVSDLQTQIDSNANSISDVQGQVFRITPTPTTATPPTGFSSKFLMYITLETKLGCNGAGIAVSELPITGYGTLLQCALKVWGTTDGLPASPLSQFANQ